MRRELFYYDLPGQLIAHEPAPQRRGSRLLCLDGPSGQIKHRRFPDILDLINPNDLLVFNDTKVIPARLLGHKATGGQVEVLVERLLDDDTVSAHVRASKAPKPGTLLFFDAPFQAEVTGREGSLFLLRFNTPVLEVLETIGHVPLPPYIDRADNPADRERYQTVYAKQPGAVAAPTAGLHFDEALLQNLRDKGVTFGYVTLHVGAGTFQPVRVEDIRQHAMHSETIHVDKTLCQQVATTRAAGGRIIAVGTTSVRCLESAVHHGQLQPFTGETDIFIYPGYRFQTVDALLTNFHLPESTLLMLVSAFAGYRQVMAAYQQAIAEKYRFFSYGDAMFLTHNPHAAEDNLA